MEKEIEFKYDVSLTVMPELFMMGVRCELINSGWDIFQSRKFKRHFTYYDTQKGEVHKKGETIRELTGFNPAKFKRDKGLFRYDFKLGPISDRYEHSEWTNERLSKDQFMKKLNIHRFYSNLQISAEADTEHTGYIAQKENTEIEVILDIFKTPMGVQFRELELELEDGDSSLLEQIANTIQKKFKLVELHTQKYSRIMLSSKSQITTKFDKLIED